MRLVNIGFGNVIAAARVLAVVGADSAPIRRMVQDARDSKHLIDASAGRKVRAVLVLDNGFVAVSALQPETVSARLREEGEEEQHAQ